METKTLVREKIYTIDLIRAGLILSVFFCHTSDLLPIGGNFFQAFTGVALEMFFVIYGFLSAVNYYHKENLNTKEFITKKFKRVFPLHLSMYILCLLIEIIVKSTSFSKILKMSVVNLLLVQSWIPNLDYIYSFNDVTWFLSSLMFCWLVTPFIIKKLKNEKIQNILWFSMITIICRCIYIIVYKDFVGYKNFYFVNMMPVYRLMEYL